MFGTRNTNLQEDNQHCLVYCKLHATDIFGKEGTENTFIQKGTATPVCISCRESFVNVDSDTKWKNLFTTHAKTYGYCYNPGCVQNGVGLGTAETRIINNVLCIRRELVWNFRCGGISMGRRCNSEIAAILPAVRCGYDIYKTCGDENCRGRTKNPDFVLQFDCNHQRCLDCFDRYFDSCNPLDQFLKQHHKTKCYTLICPGMSKQDFWKSNVHIEHAKKGCNGSLIDNGPIRLLGKEKYQKYQEISEEACTLGASNNYIRCPYVNCRKVIFRDTTHSSQLCIKCNQRIYHQVTPEPPAPEPLLQIYQFPVLSLISMVSGGQTYQQPSTNTFVQQQPRSEPPKQEPPRTFTVPEMPTFHNYQETPTKTYDKDEFTLTIDTGMSHKKNVTLQGISPKWTILDLSCAFINKLGDDPVLKVKYPNGIRPDQVVLINSGRILEPSQSLGSNNFQKETKLSCIFK